MPLVLVLLMGYFFKKNIFWKICDLREWNTNWFDDDLGGSIFVSHISVNYELQGGSFNRHVLLSLRLGLGLSSSHLGRTYNTNWCITPSWSFTYCSHFQTSFPKFCHCYIFAISNFIFVLIPSWKTVIYRWLKVSFGFFIVFNCMLQ